MATLRIVSQASAEAQWDRVKGHTLAASLEAARFGLSLEAREGQNLHTRLKGRKGLYPPFTALVCPCALLLARREVLTPRLEGLPFARLTNHHPVHLSAFWAGVEA